MQAILSADRNWGIGKDGGLLVRVSEDMKFFRKKTQGHAVVMGRKTFESLPGLLPGRRNIILSRSGICPPGAEAATGVLELLELLGPEEEQAFVIGGGEIYRQLLPYTERVFVTKWPFLMRIHFSPIWMNAAILCWNAKARCSKAAAFALHSANTGASRTDF